MVEDFKRQFLDLLYTDTTITNDQLNSIMAKVDLLAFEYSFEHLKKDLVIYKSGIPAELNSWFNQKKLEGQSLKGLRNRYITIRNFFIYSKLNIKDVSPSDVKSYLIYYNDFRIQAGKKSISNRSLDKIRQTLNSFFDWARKEKLINENPCENIHSFKYIVKPRGFLSTMELEQIRDACITLKEKLIIEFFYSTGCRIEEATRVKLIDLNINNKEVLLLGKGSKYRTSYLSDKCVMLINEYINTRHMKSEFLFAKEYKPYDGLETCTLRKQFEEITKRALGKVITPHIMRHTTATHALRKGMPLPIVQKLLGHSSPATTQIYAESDQETVKLEHKRTIG